MNIIMGLCGEGSRFKQVGYTIPKYLIPYCGKTMLHHSIDSLQIPGEWYFVVRKDHLDAIDYLEPMLNALGTVIILPGLTEGAAQSLLAAREYIRDTTAPMISINCDQNLKWSPAGLLDAIAANPDRSYILTYTESDPKCSYVRKDDSGRVIEVREKVVISNDATIGIYHWASTTDFFTDCAKMIADGVKDNGEYYVAPVYNYSIARGVPVSTYHLANDEFYPVGTPADLARYIELHTDYT